MPRPYDAVNTGAATGGLNGYSEPYPSRGDIYYRSRP
jgi:hypothetical protein